jgi:hypothetical protein
MARGSAPSVWDASWERLFTQNLRAAQHLSQERHRRESGAATKAHIPETSEWTSADERDFNDYLRQARARRLLQSGDSSGPSLGEESARGVAEPNKGDDAEVIDIDLSQRDAESTPHVRSQANSPQDEDSSSTDSDWEGEARRLGQRSRVTSPRLVPPSGRPAMIPSWISERMRDDQRAREREASIISDLPDGPLPSINVGGEQSSFRIRSTWVDSKGSPRYRYGVPTPDRRPLPRVLVPGTPTSEDASQKTGQTAKGTMPERQPAKGQDQLSTSRERADSAESRWKTTAGNLVRSVVDSIRGQKAQTSSKETGSAAPPPPPPKDPKYKSSSRAGSDDEHYLTTDTEKERELLEYNTPPDRKLTLPPNKNDPNNANETSGSDVDMTDRIPAHEKGKGKTRFADPIVQPSPLLQDARKAEMERRRKAKVELEARMRLMEDEYEAATYQLAIMESEQTALEEAEKLHQDLQNDSPVKETSKQEGSGLEEAKSAADNSVREDSTHEDDVSATPSRDPTPPPPPNMTKKKDKSAKGASSSKPEAGSTDKGRRESDKKRRQHERKEEPTDSDGSQGAAMRAAESMFKEMFESLWTEKMDKIQSAPATLSPLEWRGHGFQRKPSCTPSTIEDAATMSRGNSVRRSMTLEGDSPESSEKDTETEEEPVVKKKRKENVKDREARERKAAIKALAIGKPTPWNGKPTYDKFDRWVDQVDEWRRNHNLSEFAVIATMGFLLDGTAKEWFNAMIRDREREWTLEELNSALFADMFPPDIDSTLRARFIHSEQGNNSLRDWYRYVMKLAGRVPNLSEHDIRRQFMEGANDWLKAKWAEDGFTPEDPTTTIDRLMERGQLFERARAVANGGRMKSTSNQKGQASNAPRNRDQPQKGGEPKQSERKREDQRKKGQEAPKTKDSSAPGGGRTTQKKELSEKEKAELRAEDRCFGCKQPGHMERNCPKRREISPMHKGKGTKPSVYSGALRIEPLKPKGGGPVVRLNMIEPLTANGVIASARREREEVKRAHQFQEARERVGLIGRILHAYLRRQLEGVQPDHEWQRHLPSRLHRFTVESVAEGVFNVRDTWRGWSSHLAAKNLFDPSFKVSKWVNVMKENAPIEIDLRQSTPTETVIESKGDETSSEETSEGEIPELGDVDDLSTTDNDSDLEDESSGEESESSSEWSGSEWEGPLGTRLRSELERLRSPLGSSAAPESSTESDDSESERENLHGAKDRYPIGCAMAQASKTRAKPKARESKSKKTFWESLEDNSAKVKNDDRTIPHPIILKVNVNGKECRALLDSGAFSDFISTTLVDNIGLKREPLSQAMTLQMAVQGSKSSINARTTVDFAYSTIKCHKTFDIINIANYDMILGTPFFWQHKILAGMNPTRIAIGTDDPLPMSGEDVHTVLGAVSLEREENLQEVRDTLAEEARDLCEDAATSSLPPFRAINHHIPLIDEEKVYKYRPSKCPRPLEPMWREKSGEYLRTGRWRMATGSNPIPILLIQKPRKSPDDPIKLRACFDKREQNANTRKMASPLPDQTEVLERIASHKYRSVIDGRDAYEQIRVAEKDVWKTLFNSPSGTMESLVLQQGDCNGPATYQSLMNHIFGPYLGVWMDVYLDDIMIYSNSLREHVKHVRTVFKILREQKLFLNPKKMQFLAPELHVLGHRITDKGIKMDPHKVDSIAKWPTPTNKDLLAQFIGAVGYLADGIRRVRIPMAVLSKRTGPKKIFRWGATEQRAFDQTKALVDEYCQKTRTPLSYEKGAPRIWLVTDASMTGAAGHVCQGEDWKTAKPVAFWSGKFSSAEQAYRTHEQELLAIIESLKRFRHHLLGTKFTIVTDHERLESFMTQKDLNRRQARWLETLSDFDFDIKWVKGNSNIFADALSRIYSNDAKGTERAESEQVTKTGEQEEESSPLGLFSIEPSESPSKPIIVGSHVETELQTLMAAAIRKNPQRGKGVRANLQESETYSEESLESESSSSETGATRGGGTIRSSVPGKTMKPKDSPRGEDKRAAPAIRHTHGEVNNTPHTPKSSAMVWNDDGESEMESVAQIESRKEYARKTPSKKREYEQAMARKKTTKAPSSQSQYGQGNLENDQNEVDEVPKDPEPSNTARDIDIRRAEARDELIQATADFEESRLPNPDKENGSLERGMDVRITEVIKEVELPHDLEGRYAEDDFFKVVLKNPLHYANFEVVGDEGKELIYLKESERRILCIPNVSIGSRKAREIVITHAHSILAHLGARKTLWYLRENVWWKDMIKDITDYCASCDVCARTKSTNQKPMGLLHPLKVPTRPWEQIGVDFVGPLPEARNRNGSYDQVMVVIDHLTSMVHLTPVRGNYRARQIAEVFYETIYRLHGLPDRIISDRDKIFTSIFWQNLHRLMRVNLKLSSTYHPQTDGATERANRTMVQMIRQAIGTKDSRWLERLPAIEWAMNAARSETTGFSPFFLNYGYRPRPLLWNNSAKDEYPGVYAFAQRMKDAILTAHDAILDKRVKQTRLANRGRRPAPFVEGDSVYLSTKNIKLPKGKTRKLIPKYIGPYKIVKVLVPGTSYRLNLPDDLRSRGIHNAFHASLLRFHVPNCDTRFPGRQVEQLAAFGEADEDWEVSRIKSHSGSAEHALFELEWSNGDVTWEPLYRVQELEALTEYLEAMGISDVKKLKQGAGKPPRDDPETFIGFLRPTETEENRNIRRKKDNDEPTSPTFAFHKPHRSLCLSHIRSFLPSIMQQNNRRSNTRNPQTVTTTNFRTRMGTPYPETRPAPPNSMHKHTRRISYDALEVATAVAAASTTPSLGKQIRFNVGRLSSTPAKRAQLYKDVKEEPGRFFNRIGMPNIADKTWKNVERSNIGPIRTRDSKGKAVTFTKPLKAPKSAKSEKPAPVKSEKKANDTITMTTAQLFEIVQTMMGPASVDNALALDFPSFAPNIQCGPRPTRRPTNNQPLFELDTFINADTEMGEAGGVESYEAQTGEAPEMLIGEEFVEIEANEIGEATE